jgi:hypothetical protein
MKRRILILAWMAVFVIIPSILAGFLFGLMTFLGFYQNLTMPKLDALPWIVIILQAILALLGFLLGFQGILPGTKRQK